MDLKKIAESIAHHEKELAEEAKRAIDRVETAAHRIAADMGAALAVARDLGHLSLGEVGVKATAIWTSAVALQSPQDNDRYGSVAVHITGGYDTHCRIHEGAVHLPAGKYKAIVVLVREGDA